MDLGYARSNARERVLNVAVVCSAFGGRLSAVYSPPVVHDITIPLSIALS
jgi:hypothetical protein